MIFVIHSLWFVGGHAVGEKAHRSVTRGSGLLESWLARRRAAMAERLIPDAARGGAILDIGCGTYPYFLTRTRFARRVGIDRHAGELREGDSSGGEAPPGDPAPGPGCAAARVRLEGVELLSFDVEREDRLPFGDREFDVVTMLAVFEHIDPDRLMGLLGEVHRVLRAGGRLVLTTPAGWTGPILWGLARVGLVSAAEIDEHRGSYSRRMIRGVFERTPFGAAGLEFGSFELGMNTWVVARR